MPNNKLARFRRKAPAQPPRPAAPAAPGPEEPVRPVLEWMTDEWKHRVEAEARKRLKSDIQGVAKRR